MRHKVIIIESERGWGQKIDETRYFPSEKAAKAFVTKHNSVNNKAVVPDIYWYAEYAGQVK